MRVTKKWIDEWVDSGYTTQELCDKITMAGLEVDTTEPVADEFSGLVVAKVVDCIPHPDSDHMHVTQVDCGDGEKLQVVCGAANVRTGLKVCLAKIGAKVAGITIKKAKLRGVESNGMLCSLKEMGMAEESDGIVELPDDAPLGADVREYLHLNDDCCIEIDLTANRADCLSIVGVAREVAVLSGKELKSTRVAEIPATIEDTFEVTVESKADCPRYLSRVIKGVNQQARSPIWMTERLRRCGIRAVSPIVDVTNYVMLEFGQPLHSFDLNKLHGRIIVRRAHDQEKIRVLSGDELTLKDNTLLITDEQGPVALAGIFGGENSGIDDSTTDVMLESAFFAPDAIKGRARQYGLDTDAAHRFERGVDFTQQRRAIERATELLLMIAGGKCGPVLEAVSAEHLPERHEIRLRLDKMQRVLGEQIAEETVEDILTRLELQPHKNAEGFSATAPSFRFDLEIEEDLIEEVGRIYGYDRIPNAVPHSALYIVHPREEVVLDKQLRQALINLGYFETVTFSFTDPKVIAVFSEQKPLLLSAAISPELSAMRTTLLPSLALSAKYNLNRQQKRVRLFELGLRYIADAQAENGVRQEPMIAGLCVGEVEAESWGYKARTLDFYDVKGDVESLLNVTERKAEFSFVRTKEKCLHPGQGADIMLNGRKVGMAGILHPLAAKALGFKQTVGVFELERAALATCRVPLFTPISKYPSTRRDFAFVLPNKVEVEALCRLICKQAGDALSEVRIFDVFEDASLGEFRSVAVGVTFQNLERTLEDAEIEELSAKLVAAAEAELGAKLRK
ncbi:MAG: phenylalanine--tRNA ligase subunit beta [Succinivibrio sp.]|nr:phenylalanine--tRNA ligase subunit beta [Succinivibrio sp.]